MTLSTAISENLETRAALTSESNTNSFFAIYERDAAGLMRVAKLHGRNDAQDLYQDIALAIWLGLKRFRGDSSLRTFAYRIAHNRGISFRNRRVDEQLEDEPRSEVSVEATVLAQQQHTKLMDAILKLPDQTQKIISLSLEGFTYEEIASVVGVTESNVGVRLNRGKKRLAGLLKEGADV